MSWKKNWDGIFCHGNESLPRNHEQLALELSYLGDLGPRGTFKHVSLSLFSHLSWDDETQCGVWHDFWLNGLRQKNIQVAFQRPKLQLVKLYIQRPWGTLADRQIDRVKPSA